MSEETSLPIAPIARKIKCNSDGYRWSPGATRLIATAAEEYISELAKKATLIAQNAGRKTVREDDVLLIGSLN